MTVHSTDGISWARRLSRISELSAAKKDLVFNNLGHHLNLESLKKSFESLDGTKALGVDRVSKAEYGKDLEMNLGDVLKRIRSGSYRPKPMRVTEIPKEDGSTRPLAISCIEDKLVQKIVSDLLSSIYEPLFLPVSYGYRPGKRCHDAIKELVKISGKAHNGAVVEIDLRKFFNTIPHEELMGILGRKISDKRFLALIEILCKAPIANSDGTVCENPRGCPQGSILSPILANIYLHHVVDEWFESITKSHFMGKASMVRYADDMIFLFGTRKTAERFYKVLPKRLAKYGLELHLEKSRLLPSGKLAAKSLDEHGKRIPVYHFVGFTCYWGQSRDGNRWRLKFKSRSDRVRAYIRELQKYLRFSLKTPNTHKVLMRYVAKVRGWVNYHAISDNQRRVGSVIVAARRALITWFRRRGSGRSAVTESRLNEILVKLGFPFTFKTLSLFSSPKRTWHGSVVR
jgi:RNA-directed DNA polymerase